MRRAAKRDLSEGPIIDALRRTGWSVLPVSVKDGPDLFISKNQTVISVSGFRFFPRTIAVEVKTGKKKLRPGQAKFAQEWRGEFVVLRTVQDVLDLNAEK